MSYLKRFASVRVGRIWWGIVLPTSVILIITICGCTGDQGPAGPPGSSGESTDLVVEFVGESPILRADGSSSTAVEAKVSTILGGNVEGISVAFRIVSGDGTISPDGTVTDATGKAFCNFVSGNQPGITVISASIQWSGLTLSDTRELYLDPLTVSKPLLNSDFDAPLMASWSHDGSFVVFQTDVYNDFGLYKIDVAGGNPVHLGNYRGGACKPDGSERIAVYEPPSGNWPEDSKLFIIDYAGQLVGSGFRPTGFFGTMRAVAWCQDGDSLLVASNTNAAYFVSNIVGDVSRSFEGPIWVCQLNCVNSLS